MKYVLGQLSRNLYLWKQSFRPLNIACASGFWGDTSTSTPQLIYGSPKPDFIVYDFLSEITMSLLTAAMAKNPALGYCPDFVQFHLAPYLSDLKKRNIKIVSNAGGVNPEGCAAAVKELCRKSQVDLKIAVVTGDNVMHQKAEFAKSVIKDMESQLPVPFESVASLSAYLGAFPIAKALDMGADVVITGRCVDSALTLGPLIYEFKWTETNYDKLVLGSVAGHLLECGAQVTGGIFSDWKTVEGWDNIGFPIAQFTEADSNCFILTKPQKTGGCVTVGTVSEQLVYEIGDPENYFLPDVTVDFSNIKICNIDGNSVSVSGAVGKPPSKFLKVSATHPSSYRCTAVCPVIGALAAHKGLKTAEAILKRCRRIFGQLGLVDFERTNVSLVGSGKLSNPLLTDDERNIDCKEVMLWLAVEHKNKTALEIFSREIAPAGTGMAPGLTTIVGGRPKVSPVLKYCSFLVPKESVEVKITCGQDTLRFKPVLPANCLTNSDSHYSRNSVSEQAETVTSGNFSYRLSELAFTRSGDKGNTANIGVVARHPSFYPFLKAHLTSELVANYFLQLFENSDDKKNVVRYELPGIYGLNFVLPASLGGGGVASLRPDPQGKALGQILQDIELRNLPKLL